MVTATLMLVLTCVLTGYVIGSHVERYLLRRERTELMRFRSDIHDKQTFANPSEAVAWRKVPELSKPAQPKPGEAVQKRIQAACQQADVWRAADIIVDEDTGLVSLIDTSNPADPIAIHGLTENQMMDVIGARRPGPRWHAG